MSGRMRRPVTPRSRVWSTTSSPRGPARRRDFLANWRGKLVCDDYAGYKGRLCQWHHRGRLLGACPAQVPRTAGTNQSPIAEKALNYIGTLYVIEREAADLPPDKRRRLREMQARPIVDTLRDWLVGQRSQLTNGTRTAKAIDYSLKRWAALVRYLDDGNLPIDNNWVENQIRPWALGRSNWLFAGSCAAASGLPM